MDENQTGTEPRKLRKIKRVRIQNPQAGTYGVPEKVSLPQTNQESFNPESYYDDNGDAENIHFITEDEMTGTTPESVAELVKNKTVLLLLGLALVFGTIFGAIFFSSKETTKRGLEGVVINSDVPVGRSRCGLVEQHQGCVLYIMNPKRQEVTGKDFFATAAQWTGRERYLIETGNMHYSSKRIRPGYIAQINIPPLSNQ